MKSVLVCIARRSIANNQQSERQFRLYYRHVFLLTITHRRAEFQWKTQWRMKSSEILYFAVEAWELKLKSTLKHNQAIDWLVWAIVNKNLNSLSKRNHKKLDSFRMLISFSSVHLLTANFHYIYCKQISTSSAILTRLIICSKQL